MKHLILFLSLFVFISCKKEGIGGDAAISGKLWVKHYNSTFTQFIKEYEGKDIYVYIIYGNHTQYDKRIKTSYDGSFEFPYLYKGNYTIYTYSLDSTLSEPSGKVAIIKEVKISTRKQHEDLGTLTIFE